MCGIAGFVDHAGRVEDPTEVLASMARVLSHRGPDDGRISFDRSLGVGLAFRRLAVLDRSMAGAQPMRSAGGRYEVVFNGEIYNHRELRDRLGTAFAGTSDTETMLAAFEAWGVDGTLPQLAGMFAFAVVDRAARKLIVARDRFGVKPLYLGRPRDGGIVAFASEIKAIRLLTAIRLTIDRNALAMYLERGYLQSTRSIHPEVRRVAPGTTVTIDLADGSETVSTWWNTRDEVAKARSGGFGGGEHEAIEAVAAALDRSVRMRLLSDVPLGALLSGGIDSSAVVASMQSQSTQPVRTFTVSFGEEAFDEAPHARAIARHLGTEHTEVRVTEREALAAVPRLAEVWDEPFADSSQIPTMLVSEVARQSVTVALTGDGGDELFAGYYRHEWIPRIAGRMRFVPRAVRSTLAAALAHAPRPLLGAAGRLMDVDRGAARADKLARALRCDDPWSIYGEMLATIPRAHSLVLGAGERPHESDGGSSPATLLDRMLAADLTGYLCDDILVKVDRASMSCGLEAREPMLDHELVRLAFSLPTEMKIRAGERKWILRRVLERRVPRKLLARPKVGFAVPLAAWLRGPLRDWGEALLSERRIREAGLLDPDSVRRIWLRTLDPRLGSDGAAAWNLLMFEAWRDRWGP